VFAEAIWEEAVKGHHMMVGTSEIITKEVTVTSQVTVTYLAPPDGVEPPTEGLGRWQHAARHMRHATRRLLLSFRCEGTPTQLRCVYPAIRTDVQYFTDYISKGLYCQA
jgi:hypothetical protein